MKSVLAFATIVFALSLCNLMGRRGNTNENANSRQSGTASETIASPSPALSSAPRPDLGSAAPPASQSGPQAPGSSKAGVPSSVPSAPSPKPTPRAPISGGVLNGKAIRLPQPAYPPIAKAAHASGQVTVQVTLDESGNVISAHAVSGHPLLKSSAEAAARQAKFTPTMLSGQAVKVTGIIVYNFVMQ